MCASTVPGPVPSQSLKSTPYEDRINLYWKEPTEPNGIIIQYEVLSQLGNVEEAKVAICSVEKVLKLVSVSPLHLRSATAVCVLLTLRCLSSGQELQCLCPQTPLITCFPSSTQVSHTSSLYEHPPPKDSVQQPHSM